MRAISVLFVLLLLGADGDDANKKDRDAMQGDWACDKMVRDGMAIPDDSAQALFRTVKGDAYTVNRFREKAGAGTFKIDATKSPKQIDLVPEGGKLGTIEGIYKLEGGKLTLCYAAPKGKRPTAFESKAETGVTLTVWVREKK